MILPWVHARDDPTGDDGGVCDAVYDDFCAILCLADARPRLPTRSASLLSALQVQVPLPPKTKSVFSIALPSSKLIEPVSPHGNGYAVWPALLVF